MIYDQLLLRFQIPEDMGREVGLDCGLPFQEDGLRCHHVNALCVLSYFMHPKPWIM